MVKSPVSSKNGGTETDAFRIAKRTTLPSDAENLIAILALPTAIVWSTAWPVVLICSSTSPPSAGTPGSPVERSAVTRNWPAMPAEEKTKPPCPPVRPTPSTVAVTSDAATRTAFGAGTASPGLGSTSVICSKAKLPLSTKGVETPESEKVTPSEIEPESLRNGPFCIEIVFVLPALSMTKVSLTAAFVVLISTARLPPMEMSAPPP